MKILVAGGAGYLGVELCALLQQKGHNVTVVDLFWFGDHLPGSVVKQRQDINYLTVQDVEGFDVVVFVAGLSNDPMCDFSSSHCFIHNLNAPVSLAYLAKKAGVKKFIYGSSCSVYGKSVVKELTEESPALAEQPYGLSKYLAEKNIMSMVDDNFSVISFRKGTLSGFSPRLRFDLMVNTMVMNAMVRGRFFVNNPKIYRPVLSVHDAARAYLLGIESASNLSGVYNLAVGSYTIGEIGKRVLSALTKRGYSVQMDVYEKDEVRDYHVQTSKAKKELGFEAKEGIEDMVDDLLEHKSMIDGKGWNSEQFQNIKVFQQLFSFPQELPKTA